MDTQDMPISACIGQCGLNKHGWCRGCGRTPSEIQDWPEMPHNDKKEVYAMANKRLDDLD